MPSAMATLLSPEVTRPRLHPHQAGNRFLQTPILDGDATDACGPEAVRHLSPQTLAACPRERGPDSPACALLRSGSPETDSRHRRTWRPRRPARKRSEWPGRPASRGSTSPPVVVGHRVAEREGKNGKGVHQPLLPVGKTFLHSPANHMNHAASSARPLARPGSGGIPAVFLTPLKNASTRSAGTPSAMARFRANSKMLSRFRTRCSGVMTRAPPLHVKPRPSRPPA